MTDFNYSEHPEILKEALRLFRKQMELNEQFDGTFQNGKIEGVFFTPDFLDHYRLISFLQVSGNYNLVNGQLNLILKKSSAFWVSSSIWTAMATIGSIAILFSKIDHLAALIPSLIGITVILVYFLIFRSRKSEFLGLFNHYLKLTREKMEIIVPSETQNNLPKPPRSIREE